MQKRKFKKKRMVAGVLVAAMMFSGVSVPVNAKQKLAKPVIKKVSASESGQVSVTYKKIRKAKKYQAQISVSKKFKSAVKKKQVSAKTTKITFKGLAGATYYVRVRSQYKVSGKLKYGPFSKVKKIVLSKAEKTATKTGTKATSKPDDSWGPKDGQTYDEWLRDMFFGDDSSSSSKPTSTPYRPAKTPEATPESPSYATKTPTPTQVPNPIDLSSYTAEKKNDIIYYSGQEQCPYIRVKSDDDSYLISDIDYTVSYENNINAGTASYCVTGIGSYTGQIKGTFEIEKNLPQCSGRFEKTRVKVGEPVNVILQNIPEGTYTYQAKGIDSDVDMSNAIEVNENGQIIPQKAGIVNVKISIEESKNYLATEYKIGTLEICNDKDPISGFCLDSYKGEITGKVGLIGSTVKDGMASFQTKFYSQASDEWIDKHIRFEVEDATPAGYKRAFQFAGQNDSSPVVTVVNNTEELREESDFGYQRVTVPCSEDVDTYHTAMSSRKLVIKAGEGVRVCRVMAYVDNVLYDEGYVATKPYNEDGDYLDEELYATVRHKVEEKLWTDDMSNLEKLNKIAEYIASTTHYPETGCTQKDKNPTFWNDFSVGGIDLYYNIYSMTTLNRVMDLQGGITTCIGVTVVRTVATDDLNLPYLYDTTTKEIASGEGVWLATGSASSNPTVRSHFSVIYKDAKERRTFIDTQGLMTSTTCEEHGCRKKLIQ